MSKQSKELIVSPGAMLPSIPFAKAYKNLNPDYSLCAGCRLCEYACVKQHFGNVINPELSRIRVYRFYPGPISIPITCANCIDHPCVDACPFGAMTYDEEKMLIKVDPKTCLGYKCGLCATACKEKRNGSIRFAPSSGHDYALVCDQCDGAGPNGEKDPQCAKICPENVFFYSVARGGSGWRYAWPPEKIAEQIAERFKPGTAEKRVIPLPQELEDD